jgi:hypothetical protein
MIRRITIALLLVAGVARAQLPPQAFADMWASVSTAGAGFTVMRGLEHYYRPSTTSNLLDQIASSDMTLSGDAFISADGVYCDGSGDYFGTTITMSAYTNASICLWIKVRNFDATYEYGGWEHSSGNYIETYSLNTGAARWRVRDDGTTTDSSGGTIVSNTWTHLALTSSGSQLSCYINGVLVVSNATTWVFSTATGGVYEFGRRPAAAVSYTPATYDFIRLHSVQLTSNEVYEIYNAEFKP